MDKGFSYTYDNEMEKSYEEIYNGSRSGNYQFKMYYI